MLDNLVNPHHHSPHSSIWVLDSFGYTPYTPQWIISSYKAAILPSGKDWHLCMTLKQDK